MNSNIGETFRKGIVTNNPLLFQIIGVCPVVAIASSVASALAVAVITATELVLIEALTCLLLKNVRRYLRVLIYALLGFAVNLPLFWLIGKINPELREGLGIFLPLLAVSSVIAVKCETYAVKNTLKDTFTDSVAVSIGYAVVVLIVGAAREFFGLGTLFGKNVGIPYTAEALLMPFGGFLALGFLAALFKGFSSKKYSDEINSAMLDTSQIRMLHIEHLRQLIDSSDDEEAYYESVSKSDGFNLFGKNKKHTPGIQDSTIKLPDLSDVPLADDIAEEPKTTVGYQPFADLLATLDAEPSEPEKIVVTEPEPDPLNLREDREEAAAGEDSEESEGDLQ